MRQRADCHCPYRSESSTDKSGIAAAYYFLLHDTRERNPMLVNALPVNEAFGHMRKRHMLWKQKYPNVPAAHGQ